MRAIAPYDDEVARISIVYGGRQNEPAAIAQAYGARQEYQKDVISRLARAETDPTKRGELLTRLCDLSADTCDRLGEHLVDTGDTAGAVRVYEKLLKEGRTRSRRAM